MGLRNTTTGDGVSIPAKIESRLQTEWIPIEESVTVVLDGLPSPPARIRICPKLLPGSEE